MLPLLLLLSIADAKKPEPPRPIVVLPLVADGVDEEAAAELSAHVLRAFAKNTKLVVTTDDKGCKDEVCAAGVAVEKDVVYGSLSIRQLESGGQLLLVDLRLYERAKGSAVMRAILDAPEVSLLKKQIDDAALRMVGGEPVFELSPWLVTGGLLGGLGLAAAAVGGAGVGYVLYVDNDAAASAEQRAQAQSLFVPAVITVGVGAVVAVGGITMVGLVAEE